MTNSNFFIWLLEASLGMGMIAMVYRLLLSGLTFFIMNRAFLVGGMVLCLLIPFLPVPVFPAELFTSTQTSGQPGYPVFNWRGSRGNDVPEQALNVAFDWWTFGTRLLVAVYLAGALYRTVSLFNTLRALFKFKKSALRVGANEFPRIFLQNGLPTFSFGNFIFLNEDTANLNTAEMEQVLLHETVHVQQRHSLDVLFYESVRIMFWFHPCYGYLAKSLKEVHEYLADQKVTSHAYRSLSYGQLLIKLARQQSAPSLVHTFSQSQIYNRLTMLTKPKSSPLQKLRFLSFVPVAVVVLFLSSCLNNEKIDAKSGEDFAEVPTTSDNPLIIEKVSWQGNTKYTEAELNRVFGIKAGDVFDTVRIDKALHRNLKGRDVASVYMDEGYLFFRVEVKPVIHGKKVNLRLDVYEGKKARIGKITIRGNKKIADDAVLSMIDIKPGSLFNRRKLIDALAILSKSGLFSPTTIDVLPDLPSFETNEVGTVDFVYDLVEL